LGIVFVSLRIAKVHQKAISELLGDMPFKGVDDLRASLLVGSYHLAKFFGVDLDRESGGADQVTEHHRELATLGFRNRREGWNLFRGTMRRTEWRRVWFS
jgi:hypothetical protein